MPTGEQPEHDATEPAPQKQTGFFLLWTLRPRALRAWGWTGFVSESYDCLGLVGLKLQQLLWVSGRATAASAALAAACSLCWIAVYAFKNPGRPF